MSEANLAVIGKRWQERIAASPEYNIVPHDNIFRLGLSKYAIKESEFNKQQELQIRICQKYETCSLEDVLSGEIFETPEGEVYRLKSYHICSPSSIKSEDIHRIYMHQHSLVRGIGKATSKRLLDQGCLTLSDLTHLRRFRPATLAVLDTLNQNPSDISRFFFARKGSAHLLSLLTSCLHPPESFRFVDIETMGMFGRPVILIGLGFFERSELCILQFLLRSIDEEAAALSALRDLIPENSVVVSFNGKCFDIPYLSDRLAYYGLAPLPDIIHYDLLHPARRLWKNEFIDCRLNTLETCLLNCCREEDLPGALVPEWYAKYMETKNPGPLIPIVEHNRQDVLTLAVLLLRLQKDCYERFCVS